MNRVTTNETSKLTYRRIQLTFGIAILGIAIYAVAFIRKTDLTAAADRLRYSDTSAGVVDVGTDLSDTTSVAKEAEETVEPAKDDARPVPAVRESIPLCNPHYAKREWRVWSVDDPSKFKLPPEFSLTPEAKRLYPDGKRFLSYGTEPSIYAGFWDDAYVSQDEFHSRIRDVWSDGNGNQIDIRGQFPILKRGYYTFSVNGSQISTPATAELKSIGATFTSQSTTSMGHDIANEPIRMVVTEREYYFANIVRCSPAHTSFLETSTDQSVDEYKALIPCMFNSVGSSGSETWAMTKMAIAGSYLRKEIKRAAKLRGLYAATLLYIWKAALPYNVPYDHELRHRVAYFADGDDKQKMGRLRADAAPLPHMYDDSLHMQRMVKIAKSLRAVPPVAVLKILEAEGGKLQYGLATSALNMQQGQDVRIRFSTGNSFDIQGLPVSCRVTLLYGSHRTEIKQLSENEYEIKIPYSPKLPKGRTAIAVIANNGQTDSNPAIISVYRDLGGPNLRPEVKFSGSPVVAPGEKLDIQLDGNDPEGFPVVFYDHLATPGVVVGNRFIWECPADQQDGKYPVTLIASDRTCGNGYNAVQLPIEVRSSK